MELVEGYVWEPIDLTWAQKLAAFWSIAWPGFLASLLIVSVIASSWSVEQMEARAVWLSLAATVTYLAGQILLAPRLVKKRYRSFRIALERSNAASDKLSPQETLGVSVRIIVPQILFILAVSVLPNWLSDTIDSAQVRAIGSASLWARILIVGPYSLSFAVPAYYRGFRLQSYGRRIAPSPEPPETAAPPAGSVSSAQ
jgi:hypothetical protein